MNNPRSISIIIPTLNAAAELPRLLSALQEQKGVDPEVIVIDSSSSDATRDIATDFGVRLHVIDRNNFDHGGTRTEAAKMARGDILVFMTQDAIPVETDAVEKLIAPLLQDEGIIVSYGRQLPSSDASIFAAHLRLFNYPAVSEVRTLADREKIGLKAAFVSNSFAAYLRQPLEEVGFFKNGLIFGEDTCSVGSLLLKGGKIAYVADAAVYHSHNYSWLEEFRRSFDIGVLHSSEKWLIDTYGRAEGHGMHYLRSELSFLSRQGKLYLLPAYVIRNGLKYFGYQLGRYFTILPQPLIPHLSMHKNWWSGQSVKIK